jgi:hypothetical protein
MTTTTNNYDPLVNNSAFNQKNGRYVLGGSTEVSSFALEMWDAIQIQPDPSDFIYFVEKKYEGRPEMLGYVFYGDPGLWWIICQYNNILDPLNEIIEGKALLIMTMERVQSQILANAANTGGTSTTRSTNN